MLTIALPKTGPHFPRKSVSEVFPKDCKGGINDRLTIGTHAKRYSQFKIQLNDLITRALGEVKTGEEAAPTCAVPSAALLSLSSLLGVYRRNIAC